MKKWFREWAKFDLIALGMAIIATLIYFIARNRFASNSPFHSFMPNLATEIMGIWISVRVIERILQRRDVFHGHRRALVNEMSTLGDMFWKIYPNPQNWQFQNITTQLKKFQQIISLQINYLYEDELIDARLCLAVALEAHNICNEYLDIQRQLEVTRHLIELEEIQINRYRDLTRTTIETILRYKDFAEITQDDKNDLEEFIKTLDNYFPDAQPYFTEKEIQIFKEIIGFLKNKQNITINDLRKIPARAVLDNSSRVYIHSLQWYALMKYVHELVENQVNDSSQIWREGIKSANTIIEVDLSKYPPRLMSLAKNYINLLDILGNKALLMLEKTDKFVGEYNKFKNNIAAETAFD